jgi:uncharacterized protein (DUF1800 family)
VPHCVNASHELKVRSKVFAWATCAFLSMVFCATLSMDGCASATSSSSPATTGTGTGTTGTGTTGGGTGTPGPKATVTASARLLDQTTFGPTTADMSNVETIGIPAYLAAQYQAAQTALPVLPATLPTQCTNNPTACLESEFWQTSITAPDQLRQRVALSLSEIFVTSTQTVNANSMVTYYNMLGKDAFTNWRTIMEDVTLSTSMGAYLNMLNSAKPPTGQIANENFAREMMQLFSTGIDLINPDGSLKLDSTGNPIPVYTEAQVQAFARVYTGWTYAKAGGGSPPNFPYGTANYTLPMAAVETAHDMTQKVLLNGTVLSASQTAAMDLKSGLDNLFAHPNLPPFVCRQLIQHLVTSSPSPAYVERVATVFADNGAGVRGDMQSVLTAIFTDLEARAGDTNAAFDSGHLREPILYITAALRGLNYTSSNTDATNLWAYTPLTSYAISLGQEPLRSASVFNFFPPEYIIPSSTLNAPEFSLENSATVVLRLTLADHFAGNHVSGFTTTSLGAAGSLGLLAKTPADLVDALGMMCLHGQMSSAMRTSILSAINGLTDQGQRARVATYLVLSSSQYKILH